jgi:hypothetical protein
MPAFPLIHIATIKQQNLGTVYLFLRQLDPYRYVWFLETQPKQEVETEIWGATTEEAIAAARKQWQFDEFQTLNCGFRYGLPERDEVGANALFHQMAASYASMTGVYFDQEVGHNCIVQNASNQAKNLLQRLK